MVSEGERTDLVGAVQECFGDGRVLGRGGTGGLVGEGEIEAGEGLAQTWPVGREAEPFVGTGGQRGQARGVDGTAGERALHGLPHLRRHTDPGLLVRQPVRVEEPGQPLQHLAEPLGHLVRALGGPHMLDADTNGGRTCGSSVPGMLRHHVQGPHRVVPRPLTAQRQTRPDRTERRTAQRRIAQAYGLVERQRLLPPAEPFGAVAEREFRRVLPGIDANTSSKWSRAAATWSRPSASSPRCQPSRQS